MNANRDDTAADGASSSQLNDSMMQDNTGGEDGNDTELNQELFTQDCTKFKDFMHANSFGQ